MQISLGMGLSGWEVQALGVQPPGPFGPDAWSIADTGTGGSVALTIGSLPDPVTIPVDHAEISIDGGPWQSLDMPVPGSATVTDLEDGVTLAVRLRAVNAAGPGPASAPRAVTPTTLVGVADQTVHFGALTRAGAGGVGLAGTGIATVAKTGRGTGADRWTVAGTSLVPAVDGVIDGDAIELLVNGAVTITVTVAAIPGAFSVAPGASTDSVTSLAQVQDALRISVYGHRILLRGGDYGQARSMGDTPTVNLGHPSPTADPVAASGGSALFTSAGPIIIEPHEGETPVFWNVVLGRVHGVTVRGVTCALSPHPTFGGANRKKYAPLMAYGSQISAVRFEDLICEGRTNTDADYGDLVAYLSFWPGTSDPGATDMPDCAIVGCTMSGGASDGAQIGGTRFQFHDNVLQDMLLDGFTGNYCPMTDARITFNTVVYTRRGIQVEMGVESVEWVDDGGTPGCILHLATGGAQAFHDYVTGTIYDGGVKPGFKNVPTAAKTILKKYVREPLDGIDRVVDIATNSIRFVPSEIDALPLTDGFTATMRTRLKERTVSLSNGWLRRLDGDQAGTVSTPGMSIAMTNQHDDLAEVRGHATIPSHGIHHVGNIYAAPLEGDDRFTWPRDEGAPRLDTSLDNSDFLNVGNVIAMPRYPSLYIPGWGVTGWNVAAETHFSPYGAGQEGSDNTGPTVSAGDTLTDADPPLYFVGNYASQLNANGGTSNLAELAVAPNKAQYGAYGQAEYDELLTYFQSAARGDAALTAAQLRDLYKPAAGAPGRYGPWALHEDNPAALDLVAKTYDRDAIYAHIAAIQAPPATPNGGITYGGATVLGTESAEHVITDAADRILVVTLVANTYTAGQIDGDWTLTWGTAGRAKGSGTMLKAAATLRNEYVHAKVWYLAAPPPGVGTLQIDGTVATDTYQIRIQEYTGIDQTSPLDTAPLSVAPAAWSSSLALSVTPVTAEATLVWAAVQRGGDNRGVTVVTSANVPPVVIDAQGNRGTASATGLAYAFAHQAGAAASRQDFALEWCNSSGATESDRTCGVAVTLRRASV